MADRKAWFKYTTSDSRITVNRVQSAQARDAGPHLMSSHPEFGGRCDEGLRTSGTERGQRN